MKYPIIISPIYYTAALLPKLSVLILYLRTFATIPHSFARRVCWFTFGVLVLNWLANVVVVFFMCTPFEYIWNKELEGGGTCINQFVWRPLSSVVNIITDVIMLLLPMKTIMGMHMSKKLGVAATFAIGNMYVCNVSSSLVNGLMHVIVALLRRSSASSASSDTTSRKTPLGLWFSS